MNTRSLHLLASLSALLLASCAAPAGQQGGRGSASGVKVSVQSSAPPQAPSPDRAGTAATGTPSFDFPATELGFGTGERLFSLAKTHPQRSDFESTLAAKMKTGELGLSVLTVTYQDGTSRQFKK